MCTSPIKAYILSKQKMYEFIHRHELFCGNYSEFVNEIVEDETELEYNLPAIESETAHFYKRITFKPPKNYYASCYDLIELPCGKCEECKLNRSSEWALRCYLESLYHKENCYVTFTYNNENLPKNRTLVKKNMQDFWKRLRKYLSARQGKIRYLMCGEYGPKTLRPHYHASIFGYKPSDLEFYKKNHQGDPLFTSKELEKIWGKGFVIIGNLTYETCGYVARYCTKKLKRNFLAKHGRIQEYIAMSRRPGIASQYFKDHADEVWNDNGVYQKTKNGVFLKPIPRFAMKIYQKEKNIGITNDWTRRKKQNKELMEETKEQILSKTSKNWEQILQERQEKAILHIKQLKRNNFETT